ncbi:MAG: hypothetical protein OER43_10095 [Gammaproteobacteria bacterium]|nr:hypothetical protein [Gammaproteobacteria bacterium]MDH3412505.1 hypothetical protein [Gammaproteobacteria bacterium]
MQSGIFREHRKKITWETMRESAYDKSKHGQILRQASSQLDQLAHSLGLRQSILAMGRDQENASRWSEVGWRKRSC